MTYKILDTHEILTIDNKKVEVNVYDYDDETDRTEVNLIIDSVEFTANSDTKDWGLAGEFNWPAVERIAKNLNINPDDFWSIYEPILDKAMEIKGW